MKKTNKIVKIFIAILVMLIAFILPSQKLKADGYTYDFFDKPVPAPDAYQLEKRVHLADIVGYDVDFNTSRIVDILYAPDYNGNSANDEIYVLDQTNKVGETRILVFDTNFNYKGKYQFEGVQGTSLAVFKNKIYLADKARTRIFKKQLVNPLDPSEVIALPGDIYTKAMELRVIEIHNELYKINPNLYYKLMFATLLETRYIKHESYVHVLSRYDDSNNLLDMKDNKGMVELNKLTVDPEKVAGLDTFIPLRVAISPFERLYVISEGSSEGILELSLDGEFQRFVGINIPRMRLGDRISRFLGLDKTQKVFQTNFHNMAVDKSGFLFTITQGTNVAIQVQRFNYLGENVLRTESGKPIVGDFFDRSFSDFKMAPTRSNFDLIDINDFGVYCLYDKQRSRLFFYNENGELLGIYGSSGEGKDNLNIVQQIKFFKDKIIVLETNFLSENIVKVLTPTKYGEELLKASYAYHYGDFDTAKTHYENILLLNKNSNFANVGLGKVAFQKGDVRNATEYFKKGQNKLYYAEAYEKFRNDILKENFTLIIVIISLLVALIIYRSVLARVKRNLFIR